MRTNPKSLADAVVNGKIQPKRTKAMDMRFIGCMTENVNNNSEYIGDQENWTMQITGQNIMIGYRTKADTRYASSSRDGAHVFVEWAHNNNNNNNNNNINNNK